MFIDMLQSHYLNVLGYLEVKGISADPDVHVEPDDDASYSACRSEEDQI